ncbi:single-stranded DNA cytosine deaminase isoform X2 [Nerophis ophidion]|uniref:single-stranded DNA cytosine deaminase isoform X2 n=1 Tax=Nerophis ophidion TaxID=159077 RepID=UPI002ADFC07A|nr:single-stranded DNA cytosine deaminase isoform X2 [Nerophis ophidion]
MFVQWMQDVCDDMSLLSYHTLTHTHTFALCHTPGDRPSASFEMTTKLDSVLLPANKFIYHYENMRWAKGRNETYLCFVVKRRVGPDSLSFDFGHLRNRNGCHVELLFMRYLGTLCPGLWGSGAAGGRRRSYSITWFCSWSPCVNCAVALSRFLGRMPNLRLRIFVSRLYFCDQEDSRERDGLRLLRKNGVQITVMSYKDLRGSQAQLLQGLGQSAAELSPTVQETQTHPSGR